MSGSVRCTHRRMVHRSGNGETPAWRALSQPMAGVSSTSTLRSYGGKINRE